MKKLFIAAIFALAGATTADAGERLVYIEPLPPAYYSPFRTAPLGKTKMKTKVKIRGYETAPFTWYTPYSPWPTVIVEDEGECPHCHRD